MKTSKYFSRGLRLWHWLDGVVVIGLVITFFLRESLVSHSRYLVRRLNESGFAIADTQARPLIREMVDELWTWHIWLGYALTVLLVWRILLVFLEKRSPVRECWQHLCVWREQTDFRHLHHFGIKLGYVTFYVLQIFMVASGLALAFSGTLHLEGDFKHLVHECHETVMWFFLGFTILHILGVFLAENTDQPGIVSAMINGSELESSERKA